MSHAAFDIIGDLHGHAGKLTGLLERLGYRFRDGAWRHPGRTAVFVGDLIDRGPEQLETVRIVRSMVDAASAVCIMGNHEYNALAWATENPDRPGTFLRSHSDAHRRQHQAFLDAVGEGSRLHAELLGWFKTLPLWLDLGVARVVHACWDPASQAVLGELDAGPRLGDEALALTSRRGNLAFDALEILLKGPEAPLPGGFTYLDKENTPRTRARFAWWQDPPGSARDALVVAGRLLDADGRPADALPDVPVGEPPCLPYRDAVPLFVGHYWRTGSAAPLSRAVACVDYSVGRGGPLAAYRFDGEAELLAERFTLQP